MNLGESGNFAGQAWKIKSMTNGHFRLTSKWQGFGKSLEVYDKNDKDKKIWLNKTSHDSGQAWKIQAVGNNYYKLSNQSLGEDKSLDVLIDDNNIKIRLMETGDYSGQLWKITEFK